MATTNVRIRDYPVVRCVNCSGSTRTLSALCSGTFPLEQIHPHSRPAALAAEASGAQTDFWTMHEYLFEHQNHLEELDLQKYATELGLDADRFERDRRSPEIARRIDQDINSGERSGVEGTPTFYVNDIRHDGGFDLESLRQAIVTSMQRISQAR